MNRVSDDPQIKYVAVAAKELPLAILSVPEPMCLPVLKDGPTISKVGLHVACVDHFDVALSENPESCCNLNNTLENINSCAIITNVTLDTVGSTGLTVLSSSVTPKFVTASVAAVDLHLSRPNCILPFGAGIASCVAYKF